MCPSSVAMVSVSKEHFERRDLPLPTIGHDDALLRVERCGLCGTDLEQYYQGLMSPYPYIPGHEPVGVIAEIGDGAAARWGLDVGDRVVVEAPLPCRECDQCARGAFHLCLHRRNLGFISTDVEPGLWGAYSEFLYLHPNTMLHPISKAVPLDIAATFNALSCGIGWVRESGLEAGRSILIQGAGQRGLASVLAAKTLGASKVIVSGLGADQHKLDIARALGADRTVNVEEESLTDVVADATGGDGVDVVLDLVPNDIQAFMDALAMVGHAGTVAVSSTKAGKALEGLTVESIVMKALTIKGLLGKASRDMQAAVALIEAQPDLAGSLHTHTYPLDDVEEALHTLGGVDTQEKAVAVCLAMD